MLRQSTTWIAAAIMTVALAAPVRAIDDDPWITAKTKIALMTADGFDAVNVGVDTVNGVVTLHGKVSSERDKERAERIAKEVDKVKSVKNLLEIVPKADREMVQASDDAIEENLEKAFGANSRLKDSGIEISAVNNGVVLLGGRVDTIAMHLEAIEVASAVKGVKRVRTQVEVKERSN
jgi:hyperosmotically inducible protein